MSSAQGGPQPVLELQGVVRAHQSLRPLRLQSLTVNEGERVAILGVDAPGAEVLVNLVTGAALPESGTVRVLGRDTADITTGDDWLASLDRFGIVSPRAVLIEAATVEENLAMPFTLQIDPIPPRHPQPTGPIVNPRPNGNPVVTTNPLPLPNPTSPNNPLPKQSSRARLRPLPLSSAEPCAALSIVPWPSPALPITRRPLAACGNRAH